MARVDRTRGTSQAHQPPADYIFCREGWHHPRGEVASEGGTSLKKYLIASVILAATTLLPAAQHFVVEDTEKYCSVIDAAPSKDLKIPWAEAGLRLSRPGRDGHEGPE